MEVVVWWGKEMEELSFELATAGGVWFSGYFSH